MNARTRVLDHPILFLADGRSARPFAGRPKEALNSLPRDLLNRSLVRK